MLWRCMMNFLFRNNMQALYVKMKKSVWTPGILRTKDQSLVIKVVLSYSRDMSRKKSWIGSFFNRKYLCQKVFLFDGLQTSTTYSHMMIDDLAWWVINSKKKTQVIIPCVVDLSLSKTTRIKQQKPGSTNTPPKTNKTMENNHLKMCLLSKMLIFQCHVRIC